MKKYAEDCPPAGRGRVLIGQGRSQRGDAAMIELLSPQGMGEVDRASTAAGVSGATLMDNAGRAVAASAQRRWPD
ncbi:hypothetical protein ACIKT0_16800, partial [Hansschlegelia beijingensis]|uniref:hypothetical protein n=1 Tax=Hansschlegelia beijingensis TaxID=1133344 RepID=UPI00387F0B66